MALSTNTSSLPDIDFDALLDEIVGPYEDIAKGMNTKKTKKDAVKKSTKKRKADDSEGGKKKKTKSLEDE